MVLTIRLIGPMDQVVLNGVHEVLVHPSTLHMIISNEDHISLIILSTLLLMGIILNIWVQEVAMVLVGSKGHLLTCRGCLHIVVVMITMARKELKPHPNILLMAPLTLLALLLTRQWVPLHPKQIIIMDSHMVLIIGIRLLTHMLHLLSMAMGMDTKNQNMIVMLQPSTPMEHTELSRIHKLGLSQVMVHSSIMVSHHHIPCHLRDHLPSLMAPQWLANQEKWFIRHQLSHMVRMSQLNSNIHMHPLHLHSRPMLHMVLPQLLMGTISRQLLRAQVIHSKEDSLLIMASLARSLYLAMHKQVLQGTHSTQRLNQVTLSSLLHTLVVMGTKGLRILPMELSLHPPMVQHQLRSRAILNQHQHRHRLQLNKVMINQSPSLVVMVLHQMLHLVMGKQCHLSLAILSMTRVKCMLHPVE